ncbi:MAG: DUF1801 domain-containing protein [Lacunisphaera sp.]
MKAKPSKPPVAPPGEVDAFMATLKHPLKAAIESARQTILGVSPAISEGIKWNAPSFRTTEFFATTNLRSEKELQFIFHLGAKVRKVSPVIPLPDDAKGLVKWLAKDRCLVTLGPAKDVTKNRAAFTALVREWIKHV